MFWEVGWAEAQVISLFVCVPEGIVDEPSVFLGQVFRICVFLLVYVCVSLFV